MSVIIDFRLNSNVDIQCPNHGWNKRLMKMVASVGIKAIEISTSGLMQDFICTKCRSDSEDCNCSHSNPHTLLNIVTKIMNRKVDGCDCEHICRCNTLEVV